MNQPLASFRKKILAALDTGHQPCGGTGTHASITGGNLEPCECLGYRDDGGWSENYELWATMRAIRGLVE